VVFLHEYDAKNSAWVRGHEKGIEALKKEFPDRLIITNRENVSPEVDAEQIMEEVAHDNADVVFTTSIRMRPACLKVAAQHPKTRFLNCCLNAPHPLVRTYYPRTYEANYLLGMLAGILNLTDRVGYVAANPVYGVPAAINAFARGLRTVRPNSHILLRWACLQEPGKPLDFSDCPDIELFYACSPFEPTGSAREYGLCRRMPDGSIQPVALPVWKWEVFYIGIIRSIFEGTWDSGSSGKAINYWWGFRSDAERLDYYETLPKGTQLAARSAGKEPCGQRVPHLPCGHLCAGAYPQGTHCRHLHPQGTDGDGLAGRVRGGQPAPVRSAGCQNAGPAGDQRPEQPERDDAVKSSTERSVADVKILAISDTPSKALWDYCSRERLAGVDLILSCGDLPKKYLEYITNFTAAPILYVHGNHDGSYRTEGEPGGCICSGRSGVCLERAAHHGAGRQHPLQPRGDLPVHGAGNAPPDAAALVQGPPGWAASTCSCPIPRRLA